MAVAGVWHSATAAVLGACHIRKKIQGISFFAFLTHFHYWRREQRGVAQQLGLYAQVIVMPLLLLCHKWLAICLAPHWRRKREALPHHFTVCNSSVLLE